VLGPTNVRDGAGRVIDVAFSPLTWAEFEGEDAFTAARTTATALAGREGVLDLVEDVRATSLDPYVTYRTTYGLLRDSAVRDGQDNPSMQEFNEGLTQNDTGSDPWSSDWTLESDWSDGWTAPDVTGVTEPHPETEQELLIGGVQ
jgi:ABC-type transporter lipoprotein component MlaA